MKSVEDIQNYLASRRSLGIKLGLERMEQLLKLLGNPEKNINVIHVAGTNGKGSTVQLLANVISSHNFRVGVFSSPSYTGLTGHFTINKKPISDDMLIELINDIIPHVKKLDELGNAPTEFEIITAIAFVYFNKRVDFAIIEAGMGGRFDTTNCVSPLLSVITTISFDHEQFLGDTIEQISKHKAGIIKENTPVIVGPVSNEAATVIEREANEKNAEVIRFGREYFLREIRNTYEWQWIDEMTLDIQLQLQGKHQLENASIVLAVLYYLEKMTKLRADWQLVSRILCKTTLAGRFETIHEKPLIIVDSAHNIAGIQAFIHTAKPFIKTKNTKLLFAGFRDKRLHEMLRLLKQNAFAITLTTFNHERAATRDNYSLMMNNEDIAFINDWKSEIHFFIRTAKKSDILFITGSLHFIMLVRQYIHQIKQK